MNMTRLVGPLMMAALFASGAPALAQFETATVLGTVRDSTGAVIPEARVVLTSATTAVSATKTTNQDGNYEFFTVSAGTYLLTVERDGFSMAVLDNINVSVGARLRVDAQMSVGQITEKVMVSGSAPLIETDTSARGQLITGDQTRALPLNGREYSALALLTTGVRLSAFNNGSSGTPREGSFNVNGLRSTFNNFLIDGVDNNAYGTSNQGFSNQVMQPPPDAVSEFKVVTNNVSAEYGRAAGATVNVAYRSGANQTTGNVWEFLRDTKMNAVGFFKPATGKPTLQRNQYGGVLGGPIVKNKAFFFGDFEGFRQDRKVTAISSIPTPAQRQGILTVDVRDPRTGTLFPAGTPIPMTAFAAKVLSQLPDTTSAGTANNYTILQDFTNHSDKAGGKVDMKISDRMSAFVRYGWRNLATVDQPNIPLPSGGAGNGSIYGKNEQLALGTTYIPSGTSLFEARFGWSRTRGGKNPPALGSGSALSVFGISGLPGDDRISGGLPTQTINGFSALGRQSTNPQWQYPTVFNPKLNYTRLEGQHSLKAGYEFQRINTQVQDVNPLYGSDTYTGQFTNPAGAASNSYALSDFMLGLRATYALSNVLVANLRQNMHFAYLQDDIRLGTKLTLNGGLRYEYASPQWEKDNILSNWDPVTHQMIKARNGSIYDRALVNPDRNNFGPRLGFAYTLAPNTVVRGGWGVSYVHFNRAGGGNLLPINGPQVINAVVVQTNPLDPSFRTTEQGYATGLTDPSRFDPLVANITYMPRDYHSSQVQSWHIGVQRQIAANMLVDVAYVGNKADDLLLFANYNQAANNNAAGSLTLQQRRPIQDMGDITYAFNGGRSRYKALQMKYEWRMHGGVSVLNALTLSEARDNGAGSLENPNGNAPAPQNFYDLTAEDGLSAYNQPYNNTTSFVWALPFGKGHRFMNDSSGALNALVGGWQLSGISSFYAGEPVTFTYSPSSLAFVSGIQQDFRGANIFRPNVIGDPYAPKGEQTITNWFNKANVVNPTDLSQPFGNAKRNSVRGPAFWQVDFAMSKHITLARTSDAEFRFEAFNLFNRTNFRAPNGNRSSGAFGTITSTYDPRQLQLGLKLNF
jgi:Carboxypeptidase regulatory-like domain/TonB-dependent Receptor Plug Domain/TonB dependent receptor